MDDLTSTIWTFLTGDLISIAGNTLSIASFVLTVLLLVETRKLRNFYKIRMRGPSLIRELSKSASNLSNYVLEFDDFIPQIAEELGKIGVKLRSLERKLSGNHKASVRKVRRLVDQCEVLAHNKERVRQANLEIIKVIEELKEHQKDLHWEK